MKTHLLRFVAVLICSSAIASGIAANTSANETRKIVVIAHRGEHLHHPENTLPAFRAAIEDGADYFELDVRTTSDGKFVLMHDNKVDRTTNGTGEVKNMTFDQIRALDAGVKFSSEFTGTKVPTLDEALELAHGKINVYVDTKSADPQQLINTILQHDMQEHVVIYGNPFFLYDVHKIRPDLKVMPEAYSPDICKLLVYGFHPEVLAYDAEDFKNDVISCAKQTNARVFVDRLGPQDNAAAWQEAIEDGADGIQTNFPAELVSYLRSRKMANH